MKMMKWSALLALSIGVSGCASHLPPPQPSVVGGSYSEKADDQRPNATLNAETAEPITLLAHDDADIDCTASVTRDEYDQYSKASIANGKGAVIPPYRTLHLMPGDLRVDGDRIEPTTDEISFVTVYTDDGYRGGICVFELGKLRAISG